MIQSAIEASTVSFFSSWFTRATNARASSAFLGGGDWAEASAGKSARIKILAFMGGETSTRLASRHGVNYGPSLPMVASDRPDETALILGIPGVSWADLFRPDKLEALHR